MKSYISLKDLPGAPKGTEWKNIWGDNFGVLNSSGGFNHVFTKTFILSHPDWWAEKKEETLESAVGTFFEECKYLGIGVKSMEDGDRFCREFNKLRAVFERVKGEKK